MKRYCFTASRPLWTKGAKQVLTRADDVADVAKTADRAEDAGKIARGAANPKVKEALVRGQEAHKQADYGPGFKKEVTLPSGKRMDAYNAAEKKVIEFKPYNPRAVRRGEKQLKQYCRECDEAFGGGHSGEVRTYE